ncbi:hypothetical protein [Croceicoccus mobilis]|uniref:Uncharacterized protein n=1 Tax=Croceicoccus mobilis TaxID=1703339 RepID=A0A917DSA8_9SPHN|nr:hypothetical protein [Croceicoccus mobilis]GGD62197.1 hypothetical protein GCM10010990_09510 [Croceicoccus mobilis]
MQQAFHEDEHYQRLRDYLAASSKETDRGHTLVVASLLEEMLEEILKGFLLEGSATENLFKSPYAPFSTLSAKAAASRALGLISDEEARDIDLMCSFEDSRVRDRANELQVGMGYLDKLEDGHESKVTDPKQRFAMVALSLVTALYNRAHYVARERLKDRQWPQ